MTVEIRPLQPSDFRGVIELQRLAFPPPFDEELLWKAEHLQSHLDKFPEGQWVASYDNTIVGSCSNTLISRDQYDKHLSWDETVGGYDLQSFDSEGTVMYGLDISVHTDYRRMGIGRKFYKERFALTQSKGLEMYATACRIPDFSTSGCPTVQQYCQEVSINQRADRTLSPLLRYGLVLVDVLEGYMDDAESGNAAALLEWKP